MNRIFKKTASYTLNILLLLGMAITVFFACQSGTKNYSEYPAIASVLQHYDQKGDPRQLKAAEFLIKGMSIRQSPQKDLLNTTYFSMADSLSGQYPHGLPRGIKVKEGNSLPFSKSRLIIMLRTSPDSYRGPKAPVAVSR